MGGRCRKGFMPHKREGWSARCRSQSGGGGAGGARQSLSRRQENGKEKNKFLFQKQPAVILSLLPGKEKRPKRLLPSSGFLAGKKFLEASTPSLLSAAVKKHSGSSINIFPVDTTCQPSSGKVIQSAVPERREGFMRKSGNTFSGGGTVLFWAAERAEKGI